MKKRKLIICLIFIMFLFLTSCKTICETQGHNYMFISNNNGSHNLICTNDATHMEVENCDFSEWEVVMEAKPFEAGKEERICSKCNYKEERIIPATHQHEYSDEWIVDKEATCTEKGLKSHHCINDGCISKIEETEIDVKEHNFSEWEVVIEVRCEENGFEQRKCKDCNLIDTRVVSKLGHDEVKYTELDPTCTENGHNEYVACSRCDYTTYEEIAALGHDEVNHEAKEATCTEYGYESYVTCTRCNYTTYEEIAALGHDEVNHEAKEATCTEYGYESYVTCTRCDYTTYEEIAALGHDEVNHEAKEATCTEYGYESYITCTRCDYTTYEEIAALGHNYSKEWTIDIEATEENVGSKAKYCTNKNCLEKNNVTEIPKLPYSDGLLYELNSAKDGYIVISVGEFEGTELKITPVYNNLPVLEIDRLAFQGCSLLTSIEITSSVTSIGRSAFSGCSSLTSIEIPSSVTSIGESAFQGCDSLVSITIPFVGQYADGTGYTNFGYIFGSFDSSSISDCVPSTLEKVTITGGTSIGEYAFEWCSSLTNIELPNSITSIGWGAFSYCSSIKSIEIPNSVTSIGRGAFCGCSALTRIELPNNIKNIEWCTFDNCTSLTSIELPSSLISIEQYAFVNCALLTSIEIPNSVEIIEQSAFRGCSSLVSITIPFVGEYADGTGKTGIEHIFGIKEDIPSTLEKVIITGGTSIGVRAFKGCSSLTSIELPNSVTSIEEGAFDECDNLKDVYYGGTIGDWCNITFSDLSGISNPMGYANSFYMLDENNEWYEVTEIVIPDTVTKIGVYQFYSFENVISIEIPNSVTSIGAFAFRGCDSLTSITIPFVGGSEEGSESIDFRYMFYYIIPSSLEKVIITGGTSIGYEAFYECNSIKSIEIPNSVTSIGALAFFGCSSLTSIEIPSGVTSIGRGAFGGCDSLVSLTIPFVGQYADGSGEADIEHIFVTKENIPSTLEKVIVTGGTSIGESAFYGCSSLSSIQLPSSLKSIETRAFNECASLKEVYYAGTIDEWNKITFADEKANPMYYAENLYVQDENGEYYLYTE